VLSGALLPLIVGEGTLRIADRPKAPVIGWKLRGDPSEANEFGFRGHRWPARSKTTVLLLGDSQVENGPFNDMPEVHLVDALKRLTNRDIRVVSVGSGGWGQDQELLALRTYLPEIKPQIVALWFTPVNDLWNNTFPTHFGTDGWPKPTFWLDGGELRGPHAPWMERSDGRHLYLLRLLDRARGRLPYVTDADWEAKLPAPYQASPSTGGSVPSLRNFIARRRGINPQEVPYFDEENFSNEKTHFSLGLYPRSPRLEYSARLTRALLLEISKLCQANGARFVVFLTDRFFHFEIPDEPTRFEVKGTMVTLSGASARSLINGMLTQFPTLLVGGLPDGSVVSKTDSHLSESGNRYVMTELARWLVGSDFLPRA
jgi:hypothetical protein